MTVSPCLENILKYAGIKWLEMHLIVHHVGEKFEICWYQMARNTLQLSAMVEENFEICWPQMARNALKLSTKLEKILKYAKIKWLEMHLRSVWTFSA